MAAALHLLALIAWIVVVREQWVHEQGVTYAERLFEALEQSEVPSTPPPA